MSKKAKSQSKKSTKKTAPAKAETVVIEVAASAAPATPAAPDSRLPPPGTLLQKLDRHGAVRCECTIEEGGIRYAGTLYRSISAAAMAAAKDLGLANRTQNGFSFFGLTKPTRPPKDPLQALERVWERYHGQVETIAKSATDESRGLIATAIGKHAKAIEGLLERVA
jgi:hypothetical protein